MKQSLKFAFLCALTLLAFQNCSSPNGENAAAPQTTQANDSAETAISSATSKLILVMEQDPTGQQDIQSAIDQLQLVLSQLQKLDLATVTPALQQEVLQLIQELSAEINQLEAALYQLNSGNNCSFSGQTVAAGESITAYQASSVAFGQTCHSETRTCNNGQLSGSYTFASCSVDALPAGVLGDVQWSITIGTSASCPAGDRLSSVLGTWNPSLVGASAPTVTEAYCLQPASSGGTVIEDIQILAPAYTQSCPAGYSEMTETSNSCTYPSCSFPAVNVPLSAICLKYGTAATATSFVTNFYFNDSGCSSGDVQTAGNRMTPNATNWTSSTYYCVGH